MPSFLDDDERTRNFKDLFREYLSDPATETMQPMVPYKDILVRASVEAICQDIGEMCVQIYYEPLESLRSPTSKFTGFGTSWIKSLQDLITTLGFENEEVRNMFLNQLLELLNGSDQDMSELATLQFCTPLFNYSNQKIKEGLVSAYDKATGNGKRLAIAFAILKVNLDPEPFEKEIFPRLPPEISPEYIRDQYSKLRTLDPELKVAKVVVLDKLLLPFLMEIVILDIGFHGTSWMNVWPDWTREKEI